jgi:hypothetical protein
MERAIRGEDTEGTSEKRMSSTGETVRNRV